MARASGIFLSVAMVVVALVAPFAVYSQQSGGVFVGRGRVARPPARDRNGPRDDSAYERARSRERGRYAYTDDDLKPMVSPRMMEDIISLEEQCLIEVNRQREAHNLPPLEFSEDLLEVARYYSRRMAEEKFFSHTDPEGRSVRHRVEQAGIRWRAVGENLAYTSGYVNPVAASMQGWMQSPGHRRNILDRDYTRTAIGAWISSNGTVYFTEIFLK